MSCGATVSRPATGHFIDAWMRWRGQKLLPRRADLELRDIVPNIASVVLAEVIGPDNIFVRVAGNDFSKSLDFELTGHNFKDRTAPEDWPARSRHYLNMAGRPCGGRMIFQNVQSADQKIV